MNARKGENSEGENVQKEARGCQLDYMHYYMLFASMLLRAYEFFKKELCFFSSYSWRNRNAAEAQPPPDSPITDTRSSLALLRPELCPLLLLLPSRETGRAGIIDAGVKRPAISGAAPFCSANRTAWSAGESPIGCAETPLPLPLRPPLPDIVLEEEVATEFTLELAGLEDAREEALKARARR